MRPHLRGAKKSDYETGLKCSQWLEKIGNPELFKLSTRRLSLTYKVCEKHFERRCFFSDMMNRLERTAVPTLFDPNKKDQPLPLVFLETNCTSDAEDTISLATTVETISYGGRHRKADAPLNTREDDSFIKSSVKADTSLSKQNKEPEFCDVSTNHDICALASELTIHQNRFENEVYADEINQTDTSLGGMYDDVSKHVVSCEVMSARELRGREFVHYNLDEISDNDLGQRAFLWMNSEPVLNHTQNSSTDDSNTLQISRETLDHVDVSFDEMNAEICRQVTNEDISLQALNQDFSHFRMDDEVSVTELEHGEFFQSWLDDSTLHVLKQGKEHQSHGIENMDGRIITKEDLSHVDVPKDVESLAWMNDEVSHPEISLTGFQHDSMTGPGLCEMNLPEVSLASLSQEFSISRTLEEISRQRYNSNNNPVTFLEQKEISQPFTVKIPEETVNEDDISMRDLNSGSFSPLTDSILVPASSHHKQQTLDEPLNSEAFPCKLTEGLSKDFIPQNNISVSVSHHKSFSFDMHEGITKQILSHSEISSTNELNVTKFSHSLINGISEQADRKNDHSSQKLTVPETFSQNKISNQVITDNRSSVQQFAHEPFVFQEIEDSGLEASINKNSPFLAKISNRASNQLTGCDKVSSDDMNLSAGSAIGPGTTADIPLVLLPESVNSNGWFDFENMCRLCLTDGRVMYPIFSDCEDKSEADNITARVISCTPIMVRREDKLPKLICERCYDHLASWYRFKELCFSTDSFLQQFVNSIYPNTQEDHSEVYTHQGRKSSNIASKQTQTMPIVELTVSDESSKSLSDSPHHNKENNQKKSPPVGRKRKRTITEHCIKANEPSDVVMLNDLVTTGKTKTLVRCKKCRRKKCKCKPKRKRGLAKGVQLNGLKPGSHLKLNNVTNEDYELIPIGKTASEELERLNIEEVNLHLCERVENHLGTTPSPHPPSSPERVLNLYLSILSSLAQHETSVSANYVTEVGNFN
uniref:ZAD domain-containing protein n=1 Tax=Timema douglasi TaxID=61478 RepID=A0A7R8VNH2_TIMDO|nr:unnamed protein product [Timema douglasi]